jgi:hypothetical protein
VGRLHRRNHRHLHPRRSAGDPHHPGEPQHADPRERRRGPGDLRLLVRGLPEANRPQPRRKRAGLGRRGPAEPPDDLRRHVPVRAVPLQRLLRRRQGVDVRYGEAGRSAHEGVRGREGLALQSERFALHRSPDRGQLRRRDQQHYLLAGVRSARGGTDRRRGGRLRQVQARQDVAHQRTHTTSIHDARRPRRREQGPAEAPPPGPFAFLRGPSTTRPRPGPEVHRAITRAEGWRSHRRDTVQRHDVRTGKPPEHRAEPNKPEQPLRRLSPRRRFDREAPKPLPAKGRPRPFRPRRPPPEPPLPAGVPRWRQPKGLPRTQLDLVRPAAYNKATSFIFRSSLVHLCVAALSGSVARF